MNLLGDLFACFGLSVGLHMSYRDDKDCVNTSILLIILKRKFYRDI